MRPETATIYAMGVIIGGFAILLIGAVQEGRHATASPPAAAPTFKDAAYDLAAQCYLEGIEVGRLQELINQTTRAGIDPTQSAKDLIAAEPTHGCGGTPGEQGARQ